MLSTRWARRDSMEPPVVPGKEHPAPAAPQPMGERWRGPACQGSATGGDVFADINHRGEQCGRGGGGQRERSLRRAKPAIKYLP